MDRLLKLFKGIAVLVLTFIGLILIDTIFSITVHYLFAKLGIVVTGFYSWENFGILITRTFVTFIYIKIIFRILKVNKECLYYEKKRTLIVFLFSIVIAMLLMTVIVGLRYSANVIDTVYIKEMSVKSILLCIACTLVSVTNEELIFRLLFINILENMKLNNKLIMYITSVLFAVMHPLNTQGLMGWFTLFLFALILYIIYKKANLYACVGAHFGWNFISNGGNIFEIKYLTSTDTQLLISKGISIVILILTIIVIAIINKKKFAYEGLGGEV